MNDERMAEATETPDIPANDLIWAKEMADALNAAYPGHLWAVNVNGAGGVADIYNFSLSGNWGFRIKLPQVYSMSDFRKQVIRGGGEMLERFRLSRGAADHDAIADLKMDIKGRVAGDYSR